MFESIFKETRAIWDKRTVEMRNVWDATQNIGGDNAIYNEIEEDRIRVNFVRTIPASLILFLVEVCGIVWALWAEILSPRGLDYFISLCIFCLGSFVFIFLVNRDLKNETHSDKTKKIFYSLYWLLYAVESMSFALMEILDRTTINNFVIFIIIFSSLPVLKPLQKGIVYLATMLTEIGALLYMNAETRKIEITIALATFGMIFSFFRFYFYIANSLTTKKLEYSANGDPLTGFMNRRGLLGNIEGLQGFCHGNKYYLCALMIDIDDFKQVNDRYGHAKGDVCLRTVAQNIGKSFIRPTDLCVRYGGEEFLILTAQRDIELFLNHAKEMHKSFENMKIDGIDRKITVSVGMCIRDSENCNDLKEMTETADEQLYKAKRDGKNCIYYNDVKY